MPESSKWCLSLKFPRQRPVCNSSLPSHVLHAPPISFFSMLSPNSYVVRGTDH
jgi:hypothetical protein